MASENSWEALGVRNAFSYDTDRLEGSNPKAIMKFLVQVNMVYCATREIKLHTREIIFFSLVAQYTIPVSHTIIFLK